MAHNKTLKMYRRELAGILNDVVRTKAADRGEKLFRSMLIWLPIITYPALLFGEDDGERMFDPTGPAEHIYLFLAQAAIVYSMYVVAAAIVVSAELGRRLPWVRLILGLAGVRANHRLLRAIKADTKLLAESCASMSGKPAHIDERAFEPQTVSRLKRNLASLPTEDVHGKSVTDMKNTTAWWWTRRTVRAAEAAIEQRERLLSSPGIGEAAEAALRSSLEDGGVELDTTMVYYAISGALRNLHEMVFVRRHLVAGQDPFEPQQYDNSRVSGHYWGYAALVCAPRWTHTHRLGRTGDTPDSAHERFTDAVEASGTHRDTVRSLWRRDWWDMYHQPARVVRAAKVLDLRRRGNDDEYVE